MKTNTSYVAASLIAAFLATTDFVAAQSTVVQTTSTTSAGTITEFSPDTIVIRSESAPQPIRYVYRKTTTYVDEAGNPVSMEVVKSGLPVTVQYTRDGDQLIASKVIVRRTVVPAAPVIQETKTTTTTTTTK
jgi:CRISPR/Cas system-associated exonuclease Cas4 (RecB family)